MSLLESPGRYSNDYRRVRRSRTGISREEGVLPQHPTQPGAWPGKAMEGSEA